MKNVLLPAAATVFICLGMSVQGMADTQCVVTDKDNLQYIIDTCNDSMENRVEIYMQPGRYSAISVLPDKADEPRYISLIGLGDVTIESDNGTYESPAAELRIDGRVENINFVSTHLNGEVPKGNKGAYAVHADYGTQRTEFLNCTFLSYQTASVGMGLTSESEVTFNNCKLLNRTDADSETLKNMGALYVHTDVRDQNKTGAKLNINNCTLECPEESYDTVVVQEFFGSSIDLSMT